jgi:hypothetical protein
LGVLDLVTTAIVLVSSNGAVEGNPVVAGALGGGFIVWVLIKVGSLAAIWGLSRLVVVIATPRLLTFYTLALYVMAGSFVLIGISNLMAAFLGNDLLNFLANLTTR